MGLRLDSEDKITGVGWVRTSVWNAREILEHVGDADMGFELEPDMPTYYRDEERFKVTITVEKL